MPNLLKKANKFVANIDSSASDLERLVRSIPLIGPPIANLLQGFRTKDVVQRIESELRGRRRPNLDVWGDNVSKSLFAQSVCELAMLEMGWPNDHFLPDDPAAVVFWNHRDSLDFASAVKDIEINMEIQINLHDIDNWFDKSLGEVVDDLWAKQCAIDSKSPWPPKPRDDY